MEWPRAPGCLKPLSGGSQDRTSPGAAMGSYGVTTAPPAPTAEEAPLGGRGSGPVPLLILQSPWVSPVQTFSWTGPVRAAVRAWLPRVLKNGPDGSGLGFKELAPSSSIFIQISNRPPSISPPQSLPWQVVPAELPTGHCRGGIGSGTQSRECSSGDVGDRSLSGVSPKCSPSAAGRKAALRRGWKRPASTPTPGQRVSCSAALEV